MFEVSMQPSPSERLELAVIFAVMTIAMAAAAQWLPQLARRYRSIKVTMAVLALAAFSIVLGGAVLVGNRMFLSGHDLTLLLVVIAFGLVSAVGFALTVSGPLSKDLNQLSDRAALVARGELDRPMSLNRNDEVGRLSAALSDMIAQLVRAEATRRADAESRRHFFAAIGHDLRTPLSSMQAAIEALKDGVAVDPVAYLATVERDILALTNLVDDIFLLARLDSGADEFALETIDVTEIADVSVEILRPVAALREVSIHFHADQHFLARGAVEPVGRVIRNLVDNAIRHSPVGGVVAVTVDVVADDVSVLVADSGPGFHPEFRQIAFERFSRWESARGRDSGGSGLGLAIGRGLVEAMGGDIWIEPGEGGRVGFRLRSASVAVPTESMVWTSPDPDVPFVSHGTHR